MRSLRSVRVEVCAGVFVSPTTLVEKPCTDQATHEAIRTCHGESKRTTACDRHAGALLNKQGRCGTCGTRTVRTVIVLRLDGVA